MRALMANLETDTRLISRQLGNLYLLHVIAEHDQYKDRAVLQ